ncbi:hypothetical protein DQ237_03840 [Blastococcus sp. TF02-8]|uniref:SemiSWEET transporter n=1 Tax=Blastococcus sp. TF02-8 TaxID=2250574 RepID=UPI000DEB9A08|nr:SemiSWEET transporter [Blastococcus sp. TF02-8]RBY98032.1 hypothetical protein DQ237_03840 [Blastococcus sp. TF02-8]
MSAALGVLASTFSIALVWPQVWLSCRHRRTLGMSPTSTWLAVALNFCWLTFGVLTGDPAQIVTNAVVGAANTALLLALLLTQPQQRARGALLRTASGAVCLVSFAAGSAGVVALLGVDAAVIAGPLGATASLVGAAACLPQPLSLLRDRSQDVSGLSPARWVMGAGSTAAWTAYGLSLGQPAVWMSAAVGLACALVVCGVVLDPRARRSTAAVPVPLQRRLRTEPRAVLAAA